MKTLEQRSQFDDYEMADDYDFSDGIRGRFYQPKKVRVTIDLDDNVAKIFSTSESVNNALKAILTAMPKQQLSV